MEFPIVPDQLRDRRLLITRWLARAALFIAGWKVEGEIPDYPRLIFVVGPHTSNWDFIFGLVAALAMNLEIHWLGKTSLFQQPMRPFMLWLRGIPVNRQNPEGVVEDIADKFRQANSLSLIITPEGTRGKVERMKTGFLRIAKAADCLLLVTTLDYRSKTICLGDTLRASGDMEKDVDQILCQFATVTPKHSHNFSAD